MRNIAVAWERNGQCRVYDGGRWMDVNEFIRREKDRELAVMIRATGSVLAKFIKEDGQ